MTGAGRGALREFWSACGLPVSAWDAAAGRFDTFRELIAAHNDRAGLMGPSEAEGFDLRHLADCLSVLLPYGRLLRGPVALADVGCGAGLPGLVLAVALPALTVTAIESSQAKADFARLAAAELGLAGRAEVVARRSREIARIRPHRGRYGLVTARAVGPADRLIRDNRLLLATGGAMLLYKTPAAVAAELPAARREAGRHGLAVEASEELDLPGGAGRRQFLRVRAPAATGTS